MPLSQRSCNITPMSVSPEKEESRSKEERIERQVRVVEEKNEVVEIPSKGHDARDSTPRQLHAMDDAVVERVSEEDYQRMMAP